MHSASEEEWRWAAVAFQGESRARLRRTGCRPAPDALRPVPERVEPVALNHPHRGRAAPSDKLRMRVSACARRPESSEKQHATRAT